MTRRSRSAYTSAELRSAIKNSFGPEEIQGALHRALRMADASENPRIIIEIVRLIERVTATTDDDYSPQDWLAAILDKTAEGEESE